MPIHSQPIRTPERIRPSVETTVFKRLCLGTGLGSPTPAIKGPNWPQRRDNVNISIFFVDNTTENLENRIWSHAQGWRAWPMAANAPKYYIVAKEFSLAKQVSQPPSSWLPRNLLSTRLHTKNRNNSRSSGEAMEIHLCSHW